MEMLYRLSYSGTTPANLAPARPSINCDDGEDDKTGAGDGTRTRDQQLGRL
jgi:hypothetical protein